MPGININFEIQGIGPYTLEMDETTLLSEIIDYVQQYFPTFSNTLPQQITLKSKATNYELKNLQMNIKQALELINNQTILIENNSNLIQQNLQSINQNQFQQQQFNYGLQQQQQYIPQQGNQQQQDDNIRIHFNIQDGVQSKKFTTTFNINQTLQQVAQTVETYLALDQQHAAIDLFILGQQYNGASKRNQTLKQLHLTQTDQTFSARIRWIGGKFI